MSTAGGHRVMAGDRRMDGSVADIGSTQTSEVLGALRALGFTEYEAKVYLALVQSAPATAYEISNRSGVPRPNTYSALKVLAGRGAVIPVSEQPIRYAPQPPEQLFRAIAAQTRQLCEDVSEQLSRLAGAPQDQYVWNVRGEAEVHGKVADLIDSARDEIWLKADSALLQRHADRLRKAAGKRRVRLMIILFGDDPDKFRFNKRCEVYVHEASGVRMGTADNLFTIAIDHREMLTANTDGEVYAAHTANGAVVKMALSLIRHDYYMAEVFRHFKDEIDAAFGPHLRDLRLRSYSPEQIKSFSEKTDV